MRTLYLDCGMGAAGDMLIAALLELLPDPDTFVTELNHLGIPGVLFRAEKSVKCGVMGTHMSVTVNGVEENTDSECNHKDGGSLHTHSHNRMYDIQHIVEGLPLPEKVTKDIMEVYRIIAEAESRVHGVTVSQIHFHEVGALDAVADVTAVCMLMDHISADEIIVSPVNVGKGTVKCAHGILPVPAPATAEILKGVPIYSGKVSGELCTPTGAALLKYFATRFDKLAVMKVQSIGYGMGKKDFDTANCVRAMLGDSEKPSEEICELCCNIDDMTGEEIGYAIDRLFSAGALDVYTVPIGMKKNRPGILLHIMCHENDKEKILQTVFKHTSTLGIRESRFVRHTMNRSIEERITPYGNVRCKRTHGYGIQRQKYEYDDLARIAQKQDISLAQARDLVNKAIKNKTED